MNGAQDLGGMMGFGPISNHVCGTCPIRIDVFGTSVSRPVSPAIENAVIDPLPVTAQEPQAILPLAEELARSIAAP